MPVNADKTNRWKADVEASVDQFNEWFLNFAPATFRETRVTTMSRVSEGMSTVGDYLALDSELLLRHPAVLTLLRMSTAPPIASDRLVGLAHTTKGVVRALEDGRTPRNLSPPALLGHLDRIVGVIGRLLDRDLFPWLSEGHAPTDQQREQASTILADRLCGVLSDPLIRNAQERRQLDAISEFLVGRGYKRKAHPPTAPIETMESGTFALRMNINVGAEHRVNIPIDVVVQPREPYSHRLPLLIEAKSAGDFTNVNKRRKEEAQKLHQLRKTFGDQVQLILFLCGYFDAGYLGYSASEGLDWVWEHRIEDVLQFGL